ncbi:MAG: hypothetical protein FD138_3139 [Planctomycetota bacterium]|nr:MAG: hypothetical protein FD138_3139 [Planctomycetota bacterium]
MKPFRSWTQVGLLLAISTWSALNPAHSDDPVPTTESERPAAVTPDVAVEDEPAATTEVATTEGKPEEKAPTESLSPEPESSLPTTTATPPTGESSVPKPETPMDIDAQFETPLEVNPQSAKETPRTLFSSPTTTKVESKTAEPPAPRPAPAPVVAAPVDPLVKLAAEAVEVSSRRFLTADMHTPWQVIHGLLAYRQDFQLKVKDSDKKINALEWASSGVSFRGESLFQKTPYGGRAHPYSTMYWFEGHPTQFMGYLTMCRLPPSHEFKTADGEVVTVQDIINNAKMEVTRAPDVEMTWTLWALAHYLEPTAQWVNKNGEPWSMEELLRVELRNTIYDAPCGGTHSLFACAYARNAHLQTRQPLRGVWLEADQKIQRFIAEAKTLQNSDGSFSKHYFKGRDFSNDFNTRIMATGHMIEWLMVALPQSRLSEPWIQSAVRCLAQDLINNRHLNAECGPLYHAVDALQIYRERMQIASRVAQRTSSGANGWKAAPSAQWPQPKTLVKGGQKEDSNLTTTDIVPKSASTLPKITSKFGVEVVVPKRSRPAVTAEKPTGLFRQ